MVNEKRLLKEIICAMSLADLGALYDRYDNLYEATSGGVNHDKEAYYYFDAITYLAAELENRRT